MNKFGKWEWGVALMCIMFISGCTTTTSCGLRIDRDKVSQIKKGVTTLAEVEALFGGPSEYVQPMLDGRRAMSYSFTETSSTPTPETCIFGPFINDRKVQTTTQVLSIIVNKENIVEDYTFKDDTRGSKVSVGLSDIRITPMPVTQEKK